MCVCFEGILQLMDGAFNEQKISINRYFGWKVGSSGHHFFLNGSEFSKTHQMRACNKAQPAGSSGNVRIITAANKTS